jgi:hypothetical protein
MADAFATADAIHLDAKAHVSVDGETTAQDLGRLLEASERVMKLGKTIVDAGVLTTMVEIEKQKQREYGRRLGTILVETIDALGLSDRDRRYALTTLHALIAGEPAPPRSIESTPAITGPTPRDYVVVPSPADAIRNADVRLLGGDSVGGVGPAT